MANGNDQFDMRQTIIGRWTGGSAMTVTGEHSMKQKLAISFMEKSDTINVKP